MKKIKKKKIKYKKKKIWKKYFLKKKKFKKKKKKKKQFMNNGNNSHAFVSFSRTLMLKNCGYHSRSKGSHKNWLYRNSTSIIIAVNCVNRTMHRKLSCLPVFLFILAFWLCNFLSESRKEMFPWLTSSFPFLGKIYSTTHRNSWTNQLLSNF